MTAGTLEALSATEAEISGWGERAPVAFRLARNWTKWGPRAKGYLPRLVGRRFCSNMRSQIFSEHGARLAVYPGSLDTYCHIWAHGGTHDPQVVDACAKLLRSGETALDIGANVGLVSLDLSARFNGDLRLESFEPQPQLARHIAISARLNTFGNIRVFACLLSDQEGEQDLYVPAHSIHASIVSRSANALRIRCPRVRLDDLLQRGVIGPPAVIKIDVEGAERAVFTGAERLLSEHQPSVVFEADVNMERFGYSRADLFGQLREYVAYRFFAIADDRSGFLALEESADPNGLPYSNYAAVPEQYWDRVGS